MKYFLTFTLTFLCGLAVGAYGGYQHGRMVGALLANSGQVHLAEYIDGGR